MKMLAAIQYFLFALVTIFIYAYISVFIVSKFKKPLAKGMAGFFLFWFGYTNIIKFLAVGQYSELKLHTNLTFISYFVTISVIIILISNLDPKGMVLRKGT